MHNVEAECNSRRQMGNVRSKLLLMESILLRICQSNLDGIQLVVTSRSKK